MAASPTSFALSGQWRSICGCHRNRAPRGPADKLYSRDQVRLAVPAPSYTTAWPDMARARLPGPIADKRLPCDCGRPHALGSSSPPTRASRPFTEQRPRPGAAERGLAGGRSAIWTACDIAPLILTAPASASFVSATTRRAARPPGVRRERDEPDWPYLRPHCPAGFTQILMHTACGGYRRRGVRFPLLHYTYIYTRVHCWSDHILRSHLSPKE